MRKWGKRSQEVYDELDPRLQRVCDRVLHEVADISLIDGFRNKETQDKAFASGNSEVEWPNGKHNKWPSLAVDFQTYPKPKRPKVLWASLGYIAGRMIQIGIEEGVALRWGGDWDRDGDVTDQSFYDLFHIEIVDFPIEKD